MNTAVVTGATGFIGMALVRELTHNGTKVYAIGHNLEKLKRLSFISGNITTILADLSEDLTLDIPSDIDVFYHCAFEGGFSGEALKDYSLQLKNAKIACNAVMCAVQRNARKFVFTSTVNIVELQGFFGNPNFHPRYTCIYSAGKQAAEQIGKTLAWNYHMPFCTALIAMPYGEGNHARTLPNVVIQQLTSGVRPKLIEGNNLYDLIYISDVAAGLSAIGQRGLNFKDYYLGHRKLKTFRDWMTGIRDILSPEAEMGFGEYPDAPAIDYDLIDLDAMYRNTGFECKVDFRESILKTARWLKENEDEA
ncbi:MAG TPA: NAD(P)-dependent oxidoreductase [Caproicibacter sp.]|nr:NAD(P)-dependent oxidoreductase [Caproicibacter sp.]